MIGMTVAWALGLTGAERELSMHNRFLAGVPHERIEEICGAVPDKENDLPICCACKIKIGK